MTARNGLAPPPAPGPASRIARTEQLTGRTAVVTGAAAGIGAGIARALAFHGAQVLLVDRTDDDTTARQIRADGSPEPVRIVLDVAAPTAADRIALATDDLGGCDILVNNVGDYRPAGTFAESDPRTWATTHDENFGHVLSVTFCLLPRLRRSPTPAIVNVSSVEGMRGIPGNAVYGAYKAAVISFTASLAVELGPDGIRVNGIAPDLIDTPQTPLWRTTDTAYADHVAKWVPAGRFGHPVDCGDVAVFLAGPQAAFVTGETVRVDGGTLAAPGWFRRDERRFTNMPRPLR